MLLSNKAKKLLEAHLKERFKDELFVIEYSEKQKQFHRDSLFRALFGMPPPSHMDWKIIFIGGEDETYDILNDRILRRRFLKEHNIKEKSNV